MAIAEHDPFSVVVCEMRDDPCPTPLPGHQFQAGRCQWCGLTVDDSPVDVRLVLDWLGRAWGHRVPQWEASF